MVPDYERIFAGYVDAFNRSLGVNVDSEGIRTHFAGCFVAAGPTGAACGQNDDAFVDTLRQGYAYYVSIGTKRMSVRRLDVTPIDDTHDMVRVGYRAGYEKDGTPVDIDFDVTYFLQTVDDKTTIFAFVAGDEMALYREHGLIS